MSDSVRQALQWLRTRPWVAVVTVAALVGLVLLYVLPILLVPDTGTTTAERLKAENDLRTTILQAVGGTALLVGLVFTARTYALNREGQVTERFTRAIDQLGNKESLDVRLGGIYALERIARESARDHWPIVEVLTASVRERSPWVEVEDEENQPNGVKDSTTGPPADIQALLTVLGRRNRAHEGRWRRLDLRMTDLRRANLSNADLAGADLTGAHLEGAGLLGAHLEGAKLWRAHLEGADLSNADLAGADLPGAHLQGARLWGAHLEGAGLFGAHLEGANLWGAHLEGADLSNADLEGADLTGAHLQGTQLFLAKGVTRGQFEQAQSDRSTMVPWNLWDVSERGWVPIAGEGSEVSELRKGLGKDLGKEPPS